MPPAADMRLHEVLGILRLSHKYDVGYLHKRALSHLETLYPVNLDKLDLEYRFGDLKADLVAIPILHEVGASWLLPYAGRCLPHLLDGSKSPV